MPEQRESLISAGNIVAGYGKRHVLTGVSLDVSRGEIAALVGHNGAGKSTLLKAIFGMIPIWEGEVVVDGQVIESPTPRKLLQAGVVYVPQGNRVFRDLTVQENLLMGGVTLRDRSFTSHRIEQVFSFFPALKSHQNRRAGTLSGGEQQMLALGNALILSPRILLLDEPSLGLAPRLVAKALEHIKTISTESNTTVLIVEQKVREVLKIASRVYVLRNGSVSFSGLPSQLLNEEKLREVYL